MNALKGRKLAFVDEWMIDQNGTAAAIRAGYSKKTAAEQASRLLNKDEAVKAEIARRIQQRHKEKTAQADEVIEFYTAVMRGEISDNIALSIGKGEQKLKKMTPLIKDRLKAAEQLGKLYGLDKGRSKEEEQEDSVKSFLDAVAPTDEMMAEVFGDEQE